MAFYIALGVVLALTGLVVVLLKFAIRQPASAPYRIRPERPRRIDGAKHRMLWATNSVLSLAMIFGLAVYGYGTFFYAGPVAWWRVPLEIGGILILYDFLYYCAHRFLLHGPIKPLYRVHVLHHTVTQPQAHDSFYVHPLETWIGLMIMIFATWVFAPVHVGSFVAMFFIYSVTNVVNHGGLSYDRFPLKFLSYMARKHDRHHMSMKSGNYATIVPIFDRLFGTAE